MSLPGPALRTIRPTWASPWWPAGALVALVVWYPARLVLWAGRFAGTPGTVLAVLWLCVPVVLAIGYHVLARRNVRLVLEDGTLTGYDWRGRPRPVPVPGATIAAVWRVLVLYPLGAQAVTVVAGRAGGPALSIWDGLRGRRWPGTDLGALWRDLGALPLDGGVTTPRRLRRDFPGAGPPLARWYPAVPAAVVAYLALGGLALAMLMLAR